MVPMAALSSCSGRVPLSISVCADVGPLGRLCMWLLEGSLVAFLRPCKGGSLLSVELVVLPAGDFFHSLRTRGVLGEAPAGALGPVFLTLIS